MSFISFSLNYYKKKIEEWEKSLLSYDDIYLVKQHLKMIDDLVDEGYNDLYNKLQEEFHGVSRLKSILNKYNEIPFENYKFDDKLYKSNQINIELNECINKLIKESKESKDVSNNSLLDEIVNFSKWLGQDENTAYVFLLRDTLLPYVYFKENTNCDIYPWLIGRSFLKYITNASNIDDIIRASIFDALEVCDDYKSFKSFCKNKIINDLKKYPDVIHEVNKLLKSIQKEKIIVVESGCYGTFPLLLSILDERVDFKMFTTVPYLIKIYGDKIYTNAYEKNRLFETLYSQDKLFTFNSYIDNKFYVLLKDNSELKKKSLEEIKRMI